MVQSTIEQTIEAYGRLGREGMKQTDIEVLNIMLENNMKRTLNNKFSVLCSI